MYIRAKDVTSRSPKTPDPFVLEEKIQHLCDGEGITFKGFIDRYCGVSTRIGLVCPKCDTLYTPRTADFVSKGSRCPSCRGKFKRTDDIAIKDIDSVRGDHIFKGFVGGHYTTCTETRLIMQCPSGHDYNPTFNDFVNTGSRCPECGFNKNREINRQSEEEAIEKLENTGHKFVRFVNGCYTSCHDRVVMECDKGHHYENTYISITSGVMCDQCRQYGYKENIPAYFYLQKLYKDDYFVGIKFGITNRTPNLRRISMKCSSNLRHEIIYTKYYEDGKIPRMVEHALKKAFKTRHIIKEDMQDGYTETIAPEHLEEVISIVMTY